MKTILHLCADIGSDSRYYQLDDNYNVILVGQDVGVENYNPPNDVRGVIANPVCTEFSTARGFNYVGNIDSGMYLVNHCTRIIHEAAPKWWVIENPANGRLCEVLGAPKHTYQPWQYGSPWTKKTALWGNFIMPEPIYNDWEGVPKNHKLYVRPGRKKPCLAVLHKSALQYMPEYKWAIDKIKTDSDLRSICSDGFAKKFYEANR